MNKRMDLSVIFWSGFISSCAISAQPCSQRSGNFTPDGTYDSNRRAILSSLPANVIAKGGFYNTSLGENPDKAYVLGMCNRGTATQDCSKCIKDVSDSLSRRCPNEREAIDWRLTDSSVCVVRYSNRSFYGLLDDEMNWAVYREYKDSQANLGEFQKTWQDLMHELIEKVNLSFFAASSKEEGTSQSLYAVAQCTKDLTLLRCKECLRNFVSKRSCCEGIQGGSVARTNCYVRWDLYKFLGFGNPILQDPPPISPDSHSNATKKDGKSISPGTIVAIVVVPLGMITVLLTLGFSFSRRIRKAYHGFATENGYFSVQRRSWTAYAADNNITSSGSFRFDLRSIKAATNNFKKSNKLGHGGFGAVYKGMFPDGTEVAAKRLSKTSDQGEQEFKNEVLLVAKLQHRNLVRLLGFSADGDEKILVYEFLPNKSLDYFLFDNLKRGQLDWTRRLNIIEGVTRGILYLHQDSRLTIIHRDLKASNILLDANMNPKIADFGMAKYFSVNQTEANTGRVVGTFGYMPPEYVAHGQFSTKSDVYSFGVLILEIIGGKKNSSFHRIDGSVSNLVSYVWRLWNNESLLELVDPALGENYDKDEVLRCIHVGLLCVQENPADRPNMSTIFQMLTNTSTMLPVPQPPGFFFRDRSEPNTLTERLLPGPSTSLSFAYSVDDASITRVSPR